MYFCICHDISMESRLLGRWGVRVPSPVSGEGRDSKLESRQRRKKLPFLGCDMHEDYKNVVHADSIQVDRTPLALDASPCVADLGKYPPALPSLSSYAS